jgi:hypothetical protein
MADWFSTLKQVRATYPPRNLSDPQLGALLNEVAWRHRAEGLGLERKTGGDTAVQPRTGITVARDILRFPGNVGRDVLSDAEGAGLPDMGREGPANPATFVAPVDPLQDAPDVPPADGVLERLEAKLDRLLSVFRV